MRSAGADRAAGPRARRESMRREHTSSRMRCESARGEPAGGSWPSCSAHRLAATSRFLTTVDDTAVPIARAVVIVRGRCRADWTGTLRRTVFRCPSRRRRHRTIRAPAKVPERFTSMWPRRSYETFSHWRPYIRNKHMYEVAYFQFAVARALYIFTLRCRLVKKYV